MAKAKTLYVHSPLMHDDTIYNVGDEIVLDAATADGLIATGIIGENAPESLLAETVVNHEIKIDELEADLKKTSKENAVLAKERDELLTKIDKLEKKT